MLNNKCLDRISLRNTELRIYRGCVVTLPPPVLLPVQQIFLLKEFLLHQGTCPTNICHSTGGGKVTTHPR